MSQFSLRWNNYSQHISLAFDSLRTQEDLVDVTLSCEGRKIRAHKILLSACSTYFREIFKENPCQHPVIIFRNVKYDDLHAIIEFMYQGEVNVGQESLPSFLHTAEMLSVQGLTENKDATNFATTPPPGKVAIPRLSKIAPVVPAASKVKPISANIAMPTFSFAPTPSASNYIEIPQPILITQAAKKQKLSTTSSIDQTDPINSSDEYSEQIKMEIPDYGGILPQSEPIDQMALDASANEGDMLGQDEGMVHAEDDDVKGYSHDDAYEIVEGTGTESGDRQNDHIEFDENDYKEHESMEEGDLKDDVGSQILITQSSDGKTQEKPVKISKPLDENAQCKICKRKFTSVAALKRHHECRHKNIKESFSCSYCQTAFKTKWSLSTHNSRYHRNKSEIRNSWPTSSQALNPQRASLLAKVDPNV